MIANRRVIQRGLFGPIAAGNEGYTLLETESGEIQANMHSP